MNRLVLIVLCLVSILNIGQSQVSWSGFDMLAHYPLVSDGHEANSNLDDMIVTNIVFNDNAAYSNGVYLGNHTAGSLLQTPTIPDMHLNGFGISLDIKYDTTYNTSLPIVIIGELNRYASLYLDMWQSEVKLKMVKNYGSVTIIDETVLSENTWYHLDLKHRNDTTSFYLNGNIVGQNVSPLEFYGDEDYPGTKTMSNTNSGEGRTFRGHWKDFKVYSLPVASTINRVEKDVVKFYPNPVYDFIVLESGIGEPIEEVLIFDFDGKLKLKNKINSSMMKLDLSLLKKGAYVLQIVKTNGEVIIDKFIKMN